MVPGKLTTLTKRPSPITTARTVAVHSSGFMQHNTQYKMAVSTTTLTPTAITPPPRPDGRLDLVASSRMIGAILLPLSILALEYYESLVPLIDQWVSNDTYSHGPLVPLVSGFLIWQKRLQLAERMDGGSWWGLPMIGAGILLYVLGELTTLYLILQLSLWCIVVGLLLSALGTRAVATIAFPLGYLLTAIPLPKFLYEGLSGQLQLMSSALGVGCLQLVGVTAFREGNVIDLGPIQLQVVEACSGLRYLFPLTSLALLCAYMLHGAWWKRVVLFASSIPISIVLNGFRIAMIGVLVDHFGQSAAEGFFHAFEGWVFFMVSFGILLAEMWLLRGLGTPASPSSDRPAPGTAASDVCPGVPFTLSTALIPSWSRPAYLYGLGSLVLLPLVASQTIHREELVPNRQSFLEFPMTIAEWSGIAYPLEARYIETLRFDDYVLADYRRSRETPVTTYVAYYSSQRKGQSAHSPQSCIPGGGWEISALDRIQLDPPSDRQQTPANRVLIQKGDQRQLVLYWFKQRDRVIANEYLVKLYVFWDALTRRRTDGALIRLTTPIQPNERVDTAEGRLLQFARDMNPILSQYVPD